MMIKRIIINSFKADIKFIARDPMLLSAILAPFMLIIFLKLVFPLVSGLLSFKDGFRVENYYTLTAVTFVSVIPMLFGMVYAFILLDENDLHILQVIAVTPAGKKNFLYMRMVIPSFLSFILVLISIILTDPVPTEGWLRTIYITFLLSTQVPFVFLFIGSLAGNKIEGLALSKLYGIFLLAVPLGLILHHPWNYLAFFSPLYWISWAWITSVPAQSLLYGAISMIVTTGCILILFRHFLKKHTN
jgi:fluoroquinolone transport system permease protein